MCACKFCGKSFLELFFSRLRQMNDVRTMDLENLWSFFLNLSFWKLCFVNVIFCIFQSFNFFGDRSTAYHTNLLCMSVIWMEWKDSSDDMEIKHFRLQNLDKTRLRTWCVQNAVAGTQAQSVITLVVRYWWKIGKRNRRTDGVHRIKMAVAHFYTMDDDVCIHLDRSFQADWAFSRSYENRLAGVFWKRDFRILSLF